ncbi:hypothetical protein [Streptomyces cadmiisoli]|uniref:hypothetical protein n=1 Tax=Streptomyces cadmiisoli TaxID=2184053 RepID=UPI003665BB15
MYSWIERLSHLLDGKHTLTQLTAGLQGDRKAFVQELVQRLAEEGFVKDRDADRPHGLSEEEIHTYAAEIGFIDAYRDSAAARFEAFRDTRTLLVGSGPLLGAATAAALQIGLRSVNIAVDPGVETDLAALASAAGAAPGAAVSPAMRRVSATDDPAAVVSGYGLVLTVAADPVHVGPVRWDRACRDAGIPVGHLVPRGDEIWICAPATTGAHTTQWEDCWLRLRDQEGSWAVEGTGEGHPGTAGMWAGTGATARRGGQSGLVGAAADNGGHHSDEGRDDVNDGRALSPWLSGPAGSIAANHLVFAAFSSLTGVDEPVDDARLTAIDLVTLETSTHRCTPHPAARAARAPEDEESFARHITRLQEGPALTPAAFSQVAVALFDQRTGLAADLDEQDLPQLPLHLCAARVADPAAGATGLRRDRPSVLGWGHDLPSARTATARAALEVYADLAVDPRRFITSDAMPDGVRAWDPRGHSRLLSATEVFRGWADPATPYSRPCGLASGWTWEEAVQAATAEAFLGHALRLASEAGSRWVHVDLPRTDLDGRGERLLGLLGIRGGPVSAWEIISPLGVPVYAVADDLGHIAAGVGTSASPALCSALERLVVEGQLTSAGAASLPAQPGVGVLSPSAASGSPIVPDTSRHWDLTAALLAAEQVPLVVPLDADPVVEGVLPYVVRVVIDHV